jgi:serine/threonine-protein kinase
MRRKNIFDKFKSPPNIKVASQSSLEGQTLGKYQVLEPLGRGGMARVYRAYHPQLDRYVAIKVLRSDLVEDEEFLSRFRREAQAVAALRHPNIVQVYDFDVEGELYYMVLELLGGDTLKVRLADYLARDEQMPWGEMVRILLDVLDGLAYAHNEGMIHRDIKPANILLSRRGQAVVADFGIAQIIGGTRHTVTGAMMGTLNYMAPEQGLEGRCDARSDIYSLGIVFYEMQTRHTPFEADTPLAILMKHLNDPLPLPRQIEPSIPEPFERVVLKALAKNPADRYQSAEAMARALHDAADEALIDLPDHISLPLSFTTTAAPSESVAIFSGTARKKIADADFADDDTDSALSERLEAELSAFESAEQAERAEAVKSAGKELLGALGALGGLAMGQAAKALRDAVAAQEQKLREAQTSKAEISGSIEEMDEAQPDEVDPDAPLGERLEKKYNALAAERSALKAGLSDRQAKRAQRKAERKALSTERAARKKAQKSSERCEPGCCGGVGSATLSGITLVTVANLAAVWVGGLTDDWRIYEIGWPAQLFLVSMLLCMVMMASGSIWLLIPTGIIFGNGILFTYYSFTGNWDHWAFLWPFEPLIVIVSAWMPVVLAGRGKFTCAVSRAWGLVLWLGSVGMTIAILMLVWPWFYDGALQFYQFGLDTWSEISSP